MGWSHTLTQWSWQPRETSCPSPQLCNLKCRGRRTTGLRQRETENSSDFQMWRRDLNYLPVRNQYCLSWLHHDEHFTMHCNSSPHASASKWLQIWFCVCFSVSDKTTCINNLVKLLGFLSLVFIRAYWHHGNQCKDTNWKFWLAQIQLHLQFLKEVQCAWYQCFPKGQNYLKGRVGLKKGTTSDSD